MPNPRLTVRIPADLDGLLPANGNDRSRVTIDALRAYLAPQGEDPLTARIGNLEKLIGVLQADLQKLKTQKNL